MAAIAAASSSVATEDFITLRRKLVSPGHEMANREGPRSDTHRLLRFVAFSLPLFKVGTFRHMAVRRKTGSVPCVISWGYDRCVFFGAGARSARYIHGGSALSRTNGWTTLNDHRGRTRNDLRIIFVLCVCGRVRDSSGATGTTKASV